ncbi:MAG: hypothetical protein J6Q38_00245, partial [Clostridia bacterium]|nr:hypothetical protein [Clostridia bacterium]
MREQSSTSPALESNISFSKENFRYNYNEIDLSNYLKKGSNLIAVHTLYHGLVNRVWQSGDYRHGLILDVEVDGKTILASDTSFKVAKH